MKRLRRIAAMLLVMPLAIAGLAGTAGVASAAVVVPPGQAGHTCSDYHYVTPQHYWQTCAWADYQYVWFTVNFGNTGPTTWFPDAVYVDYLSSGDLNLCYQGRWLGGSFSIPANSVKGTPRLNCVITRVPGAFASDAAVSDTDYFEAHSPTLQVQ